MRVIQLQPGYTEPTDVVRMVRFSPDGRRLVGLVGEADDRRALDWWDLRADKPWKSLGQPEDDDREGYPDPAVSPDTEVAAWPALGYYESEGVLLTDLWADPPGEVPLIWPDAPDATVTCVGFSPDGDTVYVGGQSGPLEPGAILRWAVGELFEGGDDDAEFEPIPLPDMLLPTRLLGSPDGLLLAVGTDDGVALLLDTASGARRRMLRPDRRLDVVEGLAFSPDGARVVVRAGGAAIVWDVGTGRVVRDLGAATDVAYSPDGRTLALATADGTVTFRDAATFAVQRQFAWGVGGVHGVAFAADGLTCAAGGEMGRVVVWDLG